MHVSSYLRDRPTTERLTDRPTPPIPARPSQSQGDQGDFNKIVSGEMQTLTGALPPLPGPVERRGTDPLAIDDSRRKNGARPSRRRPVAFFRSTLGTFVPSAPLAPASPRLSPLALIPLPTLVPMFSPRQRTRSWCTCNAGTQRGSTARAAIRRTRAPSTPSAPRRRSCSETARRSSTASPSTARRPCTSCRRATTNPGTTPRRRASRSSRRRMRFAPPRTATNLPRRRWVRRLCRRNARPRVRSASTRLCTRRSTPQDPRGASPAAIRFGRSWRPGRRAGRWRMFSRTRRRARHRPRRS